MASAYPGSLDTFTTKDNKEDVVDASHVNEVQNSIVAVQTELGTDPAGTVTDLTTRLDRNMAGDGTIKTSSGAPGTPISNQIWVDTSDDKLYRRNNADSQNIEIGAGGMSLIASTSPSGVSASGDMTIEASRWYLFVFSLDSTSNWIPYIRFNNDSTGSDYKYLYDSIDYSTGTSTIASSAGTTEIRTITTTGAGQLIHGRIFISTYDIDASMDATIQGQVTSNSHSARTAGRYAGGTPTSVEIIPSSGNITGEVRLYEFNLT